jgi:hypothetical protein
MRFNSDALTEVFAGSFDPGSYPIRTDFGTPEQLVAEIQAGISSDSMRSYLLDMQQYHTRNTASDTLSATRGIGGARDWALRQFERFSEQQDGRLITGFFEFDENVCGMTHHKNVVAMIPGSKPERGVIIIEAHMDSRCDVVCDTTCSAQGMEDNGSGVALVLELARVLSRYNYPETIVFVETIGEEQGLVGANALAEYALQQQVPILMVQNNDVIGGIICGETSSPPSCPGLDHVDSTQVRLFSQGGFNSAHKAVCRYAKLQYEEMLRPIATVPMTITIMSAEDRQGRGGDHIPFRQRNFPAMRFTSANEHGDAGVGPDYHDRQHTSDDILGVDTDGDMVLDSFFVDFNYLTRNAAINATTAVMAAISPDAPTISLVYFDRREFYIEIESETDYPEYRVGVRTDFNDFDTIHSIVGGNSGVFETAETELFIFLTVMAVDSNGIESLTLGETRVLFTATEEPEAPQKQTYLLQNRPNPFDESTILSYWLEKPVQYQKAEIVISDMSGRVIERTRTTPQSGMNEVVYFHGYQASGSLVYALVIDGEVIDQKRMIFAN